MRAQIERQPLTTSCLGVTAQPHLSVCVPRWTLPKGQWLPAQPCVCEFCFRVCTHTAADLCAHALVSLPVFACVPLRTSCLLSVSKLALSVRQIRWVNNCPGLPVSDMVADKCSSLPPFPDVPWYQAQGTGTNHAGESQAPAAATGLRVKAYCRTIIMCWYDHQWRADYCYSLIYEQHIASTGWHRETDSKENQKACPYMSDIQD